jgi:predicted enzyme related to lactoylglutathione lyase
MAQSNIGEFVWHELMAKDARGAIDFYTEVIGWKTEPFGPDYTMWVSSQGPLGGTMKLPESAANKGVPPHWIGSVQVASVDDTAAHAKRLGGSVYQEPMDIPKVGRYAVIADPQGAVLALFKPGGAPMERHDPSKEGEFCWNELMTSDRQAALRFYSELFGWKTGRDMDMGDKGTYTTFGLGGEQDLGGMMTTPKALGMPPTWIYYTETHDLDGTLARAKRRGGKVMNGPMEVPGGGSVAQLTDPQGVVFALHASPKKG